MTRTTKTAGMPRILIFSAAKPSGGKNSRPDLGLRGNNRLPGADREKTGHLSNVKPIDPADRRIFDGPVDMIELYRAGLKPQTRMERINDWLGDIYGNNPRGLAWFAATLFPIVAASFAIGYFGGRELLALVLR